MNKKQTKAKIFSLANRSYRIKARAYTYLYKAFLGHIGRYSTLAKVAWLSNPDRVFIGSSVFIAPGSRLEAIQNHHDHLYDGSIHIGDGTVIEPHAHIGAAARLEIGCNVLMGTRVFITDHDHQFTDSVLPIRKQPLIVSPVIIEDSVWLGENTTVLKGVTIGHHAVIGANSVVTKNVPPFAIAVGSPARVVRQREIK